MEMGRIKAQALCEYAMFIAAIIAALVGMQVYFSRSLQGRYKYYTDYMAMGDDQFSPTSSRYFKLSETLPFGTERIKKNPDEDEENQFFSLEEDKDHRITRVISGDGWIFSVPGEDFFSGSAPGELKAVFAGIPIDLEYYVDSLSSHLDDFSDRKLSSEAIFK
jgi:hypothetical protein